MALLWCDGFDHYGSKSNMTEGPYAEISAHVDISSFARTGSSSIKFDVFTTADAGLRRVFGAPKKSAGLGAAWYFNGLPSINNRCLLYSFKDAANQTQVSAVVQSTGTISIIRGDDVDNPAVVLATSATTAIVAEAWQHVEMFATIDNSVGYAEVRVNGVTVVSVADVDTQATSLSETSQCKIGRSLRNLGAGSAEGVPVTYIDDLYAYDNTGSFNNSFLGDRRVITLRPNANTAEADWTPVGAATGYEAIDDVAPDGDTTYISSATVGDVSEFQYENMPAGISNIAAVVAVNMSRKTDAGPTNMQVSAISGASVTDGADRPITERYTYWQDVFETDPASAAPFTPAEVDALKIRFNRTT